jgi:hypothetical protein
MRRAVPQRVFPMALISFAVSSWNWAQSGIAKLLFRLNFLITSASFELAKCAELLAWSTPERYE